MRFIRRGTSTAIVVTHGQILNAEFKKENTSTLCNPGPAAKCSQQSLCQYFLFSSSSSWFLNDLAFISLWLMVFCKERGRFLCSSAQICFHIIIQHRHSNWRGSACKGLSCFTFFITLCQVTVAHHNFKCLGLNLSSCFPSKNAMSVAKDLIWSDSIYLISMHFLNRKNYFLLKSSCNYQGEFLHDPRD